MIPVRDPSPSERKRTEMSVGSGSRAELVAIPGHPSLQLVGVGDSAFLAGEDRAGAELADRGANVVDAMRVSKCHDATFRR